MRTVYQKIRRSYLKMADLTNVPIGSLNLIDLAVRTFTEEREACLDEEQTASELSAHFRQLITVNEGYFSEAVTSDGSR